MNIRARLLEYRSNIHAQLCQQPSIQPALRKSSLLRNQWIITNLQTMNKNLSHTLTCGNRLFNIWIGIITIPSPPLKDKPILLHKFIRKLSGDHALTKRNTFSRNINHLGICFFKGSYCGGITLGQLLFLYLAVHYLFGTIHFFESTFLIKLTLDFLLVLSTSLRILFNRNRFHVTHTRRTVEIWKVTQRRRILLSNTIHRSVCWLLRRFIIRYHAHIL